MLHLLNDNRAGELILCENMANSLHTKIRKKIAWHLFHGSKSFFWGLEGGERGTATERI